MSSIENKDITIVFQGPISDKFTKKCLLSARKFFPEAHILLSTWRDSNVNGLDFDTLILNDDPGTNLMMSGKYQSNCFRQIISSCNGLKACKTKYVLKIRTDICLTNKNIHNYFDFLVNTEKQKIGT